MTSLPTSTKSANLWNGPLTTIFTQAPSCLANIYGEPVFYMLGDFPALGIQNDVCYPPYFYHVNTVDVIGWYSPAVCPSGYTSAINYTTTHAELEKDYIAAGATTSLVPDETTVWCCPSGFYMRPNVYRICSGYMSNFIYTSCIKQTWTTTSYPTLGSFRTCASTTTAMQTEETPVEAHVIWAKYQPSDLPVLAKASPKWGITGVSETLSTTNSLLGTSTASTAPASSTNGLSQDARIAVGVTIPLVFITGLLAALLLWRHRRKKRTVAVRSNDPADGILKPELEAGMGEMPRRVSPPGRIHDAGDGPLDRGQERLAYEVEGDCPPHEMSHTTTNRAELDIGDNLAELEASRT